MIRYFVINRNLGLLWFGQVVSQAGDSLYQIALIWLILEMTGSGTVTGLVAMSGFLPTLLFGLWAGVLADAVNRRNLMIFADVLRFLLVLILPILYYSAKLNSLILGLITFSIATCSAFFSPAKDAVIPQIVPQTMLVKANAMIQTSWQLAVLLGPLLASFLLNVFGLVNLFYADAVSFLVSMGAIFFLKVYSVQPISARNLELGESGSLHKTWSSVRDGIIYALHHKVISVLLLITALDNLILMGAAMIGTPIFVRSVLGKGPAVYALVEACYASGMVVGIPLVNLLGKYMTNGAMIGCGMIMDGLTFIPLLWVKTTRGAMITILIHAIFIPMITASRATLIQHLVPANFQGRMFSLNAMAVVGATSLSIALTGMAADHFHITHIFVIIGVGAALCGFWALGIKSFRNAD